MRGEESVGEEAGPGKSVEYPMFCRKFPNAASDSCQPVVGYTPLRQALGEAA